jgi:hypothetical protein
MGRVWVLDTETKGTGAEMLPLEKVLREPGPGRPPVLAPTGARGKAPRPEPESHWRFKVVDVMTQRPLAEDVDVRATIDALADVRSPVDVAVYARGSPSQGWRPLTLRDRKKLWGLRRPSRAEGPGGLDPDAAR